MRDPTMRRWLVPLTGAGRIPLSRRPCGQSRGSTTIRASSAIPERLRSLLVSVTGQPSRSIGRPSFRVFGCARFSVSLTGGASCPNRGAARGGRHENRTSSIFFCKLTDLYAGGFTTITLRGDVDETPRVSRREMFGAQENSINVAAMLPIEAPDLASLNPKN